MRAPLGRNLAAVLLLLLAAWAVHDASTLGWGGADAPDGTRYKVSPVGIAHVLDPRAAASPTVRASWAPEAGDSALRAVAPGGEAAYARLRKSYPTLRASLWPAVLGALFAAVPRRRAWHRALAFGLPAVAAAAVVAGMVLFLANAQRALAVLAPLEFGWGGTLGYLEASAAPLLLLGAPALLVRGSRPAAVAAWLAGAVLLTWGITITRSLHVTVVLGAALLAGGVLVARAGRRRGGRSSSDAALTGGATGARR